MLKTETNISLYNALNDAQHFSFSNNLYYQKNFPVNRVFESNYIKLREKEGRMYSDEYVRQLPDIAKGHALEKEWKVRQYSANKLLQYILSSSGKSILDVGCGNGWLTHHLAQLPGRKVLGVDVNETELTQAARLFQKPDIFFLYADIFTVPLPERYFDTIVLAGCVQYFASVKDLLLRLKFFLKPGGEIHIIDSPVYQRNDVPAAQERSKRYFRDHGFEEQHRFYHHHAWDVFDVFHYRVLYDPAVYVNRVKRRFSCMSPFPWIKVFF